MKTRSTTILSVRHRGQVALGGDGQVTLGTTVMKADANKIRRLMDGQVITGFAGSSADAFALLERFEAKLRDFPGNTARAATELAKDWRSDRVLRRLEALLAVVDAAHHAVGDRDWRRDPADRRRAGDRLGRKLRGGRGAGAGGARRIGRGHDRAARAGDRRRHRHLHEHAHSRGDAAVCAMTAGDLTPRQIVAELDRHIVGQHDAKRAVAIAVRNRWRRQQLPPEMRAEIAPKNILMIGPTGVGKTEIVRRLARLTGAPFIKVEATKYTEVGYYGRDVESMIRELVENGIALVRASERKKVEVEARERVEQRLVDLLAPAPVAYDVGAESANSPERYERTREKMRAKLAAGELDDRKVEIAIEQKSPPMMLSGLGLEQADIDLQGMFEKILPKQSVRREMTVAEARRVLFDQQCDALVNQEKVHAQAIELAENLGIVFIDEIDKVVASDARGADVSRQGVQRDLLPIVEGTTVQTKYGYVKTDHILFVAAGAFHRAKPSELMPELQGRFPIRVELEALTRDDFVRILTEPSNSLTRQYVALLSTEQVELEFEPAAIAALADFAFRVNQTNQNIGARRLYTIMERLLEDLSFDVPDGRAGRVVVSEGYVNERLQKLRRMRI